MGGNGTYDSADRLQDELAPYLNPVMSRFLLNVSKAITQDPGLPKTNPTVSAWQVPEHPIGSIQSPTFPKQTDFAVIGSGITGCSVTKTLLEHQAAGNSHITVLEARTLVSGATGRNGGHLVTASGHTFGPLVNQHGVEAAKQITRFSILNIARLMEMVKEMEPELQEACQIRDVLKVMAVGDEETWKAAKQSVLDFQQAVPEHQSYHRIIQKDDVPERWNIKNASGAVEHDAGAIWPYRLLTGIYDRLLKRIWIGNETAYMKDILTSDDTYVPVEAKKALSTVLPKFFLDGWGSETTSEIEAIWSGIQGHTADGLPIVGQIPQALLENPGDDGQWMACGFNGYGMDKCWLTGEALVKMMLGEDVSDWFPQAYMVTEERLQKGLTSDKTLLKFAQIAKPGGVKIERL
ncbi:Gamma-glutamylputrescine oxidoreductase [Colletotrichum sp. SAR 10_77]|nr:Gamma-glutamylputrescine oxidoreductase [Colletotrichum sp. SAR 10_77]